MSLRFTNVDTIASVARIFIKYLRVNTLAQLFFETKSIVYFIGGLEYNGYSYFLFLK